MLIFLLTSRSKNIHYPYRFMSIIGGQYKKENPTEFYGRKITADKK